MTTMPPVRLGALLLLVGGLSAACASPCHQVQQALCRCVGRTQTERSSCEDAASAQEALSPPSDSQLASCEALLTGCERVVAAGCEGLRTEEGKKACGLALP
jgi:hypothetical protein